MMVNNVSVSKYHRYAHNPKRKIGKFVRRDGGVGRHFEDYTSAKRALSGAHRNIWIKQTTKPNSDRILLVQFSSKIITDTETQDAIHYYDTVYKNVPSYVREEDFWEVPVWIPAVANSLPNADVYIVRNVEEAESFIRDSGYDSIMFSAMDANVDLIRQLASVFPSHVYVGGYVRKDTFSDLGNTKWIDSIEELASEFGVPYQEGVDYRHFRGSKAIPRLCMSTGCYHDCAFCTVPKQVKATPKSAIDQEVDEIIKYLDSDLVYLNDKTFGQSPNYTYLKEIYDKIKEARPSFKGFVIQTTAGQLLKIPDEFLTNAGIQYVEIGVESYNDEILRAFKKPHTTTMIDQAVEKLRNVGINFVPNIIIGMKGETTDTYQNTLDFIRRNEDIISHLNVYNLALYEGTEMKEILGVKTDADVLEGAIEKSWHEQPEIHQKFAKDIYGLASTIASKRR